MSALKRWRKRVEVGLMRLALALVPRLPRRLVVALARGIGTLMALLPLALRRVGMANLDLAFGDGISPADKRALLRRSCQTFALVLLDVFWFSRHTRERVLAHTRFDPALDQELFQDKAHLCITGHLGNWELLGHAVSVRGYPLHSIAAPLVNPGVEPYLEAIRTRSGQVIFSKAGAVRAMLRTLKQNGKVGLLLDQNTAPDQGGRFVSFFGVPAPMSDAAIALAQKTRTDIVFGFCIPDEQGEYYVHTVDPIPVNQLAQLPDGATPEETLTQGCQLIADRLETAIRAHPQAWLWMYKRWKFIPPGAAPDAFPFYARP
jgi:Kdo2-lipid IVA lauroyltransferase/acyltransferase